MLRRACDEKEELLDYEKVGVSWVWPARSSLNLTTSVHAGLSTASPPISGGLGEALSGPRDVHTAG